MNKLNVKYRDLVLLALFAAIVLVLGFTPLGFIPLVVIKATIVHIPVIIGSIVLGPKKGAILGALFGICSLITNTVSPALTSFVFTPFYPLPGQEHGSWLS
ncbi:MAG: ECF transporter S component [Eubacteriales bacterium]